MTCVAFWSNKFLPDSTHCSIFVIVSSQRSMMLSARSLFLGFLPVLVYGQYQFFQEYSGSTFFDRWQFYDNCTSLSPHSFVHSRFCSRQSHAWRRNLRLTRSRVLCASRLRQRCRQCHYQGRQHNESTGRTEAQYRPHPDKRRIWRGKPMDSRYYACPIWLQVCH